jgi:hypothetical protein
MAFMNDCRGVFLVLGLAREGELVLGLAVGDFVNAVEVRWREILRDRAHLILREGKLTHRNHSFVARTRPGR